MSGSQVSTQLGTQVAARAGRPNEAAPRPFHHRLLDGWMQIVAHFGEVQTLVLLGLIYSLVIGPASIVSRTFGSDFLSKRGLRAPGSAWRDADSRPPELENVKQPY